MYQNFIPVLNGYTNLPFWNTSVGQTTNMSYDIRGDQIIIPKFNNAVRGSGFIWNNPSITPIYNRHWD